MNILINYNTLVSDNDFNVEVIKNDPVMSEIHKIIQNFNKENVMKIMNTPSVISNITKLEKMIKKLMIHVNIKDYYIVFEDSILFQIRNNRINYNKEIPVFMNKDFLKGLLGDIISKYVECGQVSNETVNNGRFNEDFLMMNFVIFKKGAPFIFIEPGELNSNNKNNCWRFVERMVYGFDTDGIDDDREDDDDEEWW